MTDKELRELDTWIAEHVMDWKWYARPSGTRVMQVLEKCLSHPKCSQITIGRTDTGYGIVSGCDEFAETLPLAICLFAKALFSDAATPGSASV